MYIKELALYQDFSHFIYQVQSKLVLESFPDTYLSIELLLYKNIFKKRQRKPVFFIRVFIKCPESTYTII